MTYLDEPPGLFRRDYNPAADESLKQQFGRFASRMKHRFKGEALTLDDINVIKLPYAPVGTWDDLTGAASYFATRNPGGKWNIEEKTNFGAEAEPFIKTVATDLDLPAALNQLAELNPRAMLRETTKFWHPASVSKLIGHSIPGFGCEEVKAAGPAVKDKRNTL